jgi:predicted nucleic acid-binding protein
MMLIIDTPLFKMLVAPIPTNLQKWCETNEADLYLSVASVTEVAIAINKVSVKQPNRGKAQREWLESIQWEFSDRIHAIDTSIASRAAALMPRLSQSSPRFRVHDAYLVATAQIHGHGLLTRRDDVFGLWTQIPVKAI